MGGYNVATNILCCESIWWQGKMLTLYDSFLKDVTK